ncbi:MAG: VOC family protein [Phycisphaerae bacterium]
MPSPMGFDQGLTLTFQVRDRKKTAQWYTDLLGLKLLYDVAEIGWCELATETAGVNIGLSEVESAKTAGGCVPVFGITDIDAARARLESHKVRFDGPTREIPGLVRLATFFDPDGNALMLSQNLEKK